MSKEGDDIMWEYPAHTKAKHEILDRYLGGWFAKLSRYPRILFFDGFAGRGVYTDGTQGSPLIALKKLLGHSALSSMSACEFVFMFVEKDKKNAAILTSELAALEAAHGKFPPNLKYSVIEGNFSEVAGRITAQLAEQKKRQAPTFAFIDPFGYSELPLDTIAEFTQFPGSEVLVNLMVNHLGRFIDRDGQENAVGDLFGLSPAQVMADRSDDQSRAEHLRDVYIDQLRERAKFPYVNWFAMKNASGNVGYYLIHGTRHRDGVQLMKDAMWKVDPEGGSVFSDRLAGREVLFTVEPDLSPLEDALRAHFSGQRIQVEDLRWFAVLETPYRETHIIPLLRDLEKRALITVERSKKSGYERFTTYVTF